LFQGLVAGLLRPRPSLKQIEQSSSSGKFRERHTSVPLSKHDLHFLFFFRLCPILPFHLRVGYYGCLFNYQIKG
jgi:hypothetical protein